ncbi:lymphatic vessel endothelial hyaluronic acid receptor 1 isoform X2 [Hemicordylus capensis]|uniref:lymphatic vessel endothelial hyaluronic acid receptor 1 isoform X2 n=1 Tax=Hemicordylus capensis TaxID=884348 RepID=UPI002302D886|nr:lymphatic vessel endothelial hyaluronic acid receptor 1 isoform X2 [Hemicordylus capensis]
MFGRKRRKKGGEAVQKYIEESALNTGNTLASQLMSFGWVAEKYVVIARIIPNIKCGRNQTGVIPWKGRPLNYKAHGYCYNSSDIWINSCIPEEASTTALPDVSTETNSTSTISFEDTSAMAQTSEPLQTKRHQECRIICRPEIIPPTELTTEDMALVPKNQAAFRNDVVVFGGVPTTLLVLALIFFAAATVLAVCYIKRYRQTLPSSKKKKNELIETKDIKETKATLVPEQEAKNGKKTEELPAKPEQAKCLEAEV